MNINDYSIKVKNLVDALYSVPYLNCCRNPTLAKCGGEAQHLEKVRIWSPPGLPNV